MLLGEGWVPVKLNFAFLNLYSVNCPYMVYIIEVDPTCEIVFECKSKIEKVLFTFLS